MNRNNQIPSPLKDREYWIDAVRSFACLCVITTHAPIPNSGGGASLIAATNYYSVAGASILFFDDFWGVSIIQRKRSNTFP